MDKQTNRQTEITAFQMLRVSPNGDYFAKTMRDAAQQCIIAQISAFCAKQNLQMCKLHRMIFTKIQHKVLREKRFRKVIHKELH